MDCAAGIFLSSGWTAFTAVRRCGSGLYVCGGMAASSCFSALRGMFCNCRAAYDYRRIYGVNEKYSGVSKLCWNRTFGNWKRLSVYVWDLSFVPALSGMDATQNGKDD